jgi:hypothetical protein
MSPLRRSKPIPASPWFGTVVAVTLLLAGGIGSIYGGEIRRAFPFTWMDGRVNGPAFFWTFVLTAGALLTWRQWQVDRVRERSQDALIQAQDQMMDAQGKMIGAQSEMIAAQKEAARLTDKLQFTVRTMPPAEFLDDYARYYRAAEEIVRLMLAAPPAERTPEVLRAAIRRLLRILALLAKRFDSAPASVSYGANLMVYRRLESIPGAERDGVKNRIRGVGRNGGLDEADGILDLHPELTTVAEDDNAAPSASLRDPLALVIPRKPYADFPKPGESHRRFRITPGAPVAFVLRTFSQMPDTAKVRDWCDTETILNNDEVSDVEHYFEQGQGSDCKSFASIALHAPGADPLNEDPVAVLNLDSQARDMLRGSREVVLQYMRVTTPFQLLLAVLAAELSAVEEARLVGTYPGAVT